MEWVSVEKKLPENRVEVLALIEGYFPGDDNPLCQKRKMRVFQCFFDRSSGWHIPYCPDDGYVRYWMPLPEVPK